MEEKFLSVKDLHVHYLTSDANVYAVNGISFELERGKTWAWWGRPVRARPPLPGQFWVSCRSLPEG